MELRDVMGEVRRRTFGLVAHLDDAQLSEVHDPIMSPLAWDLGHVAAYEDLWLNHRVAGRDLLRPGLAELYDAFETPRAVRGDLEFLRGDELREYMAAVRERSLEAPVDRELHELVIRHELQHTETMLQAMYLAGLEPPRFTGPAPVPGTGLELVEVAAGPAEIGAGPDGFAYDNERPRHTVDVGAFRIGRTPITNATWLTFAEGGGYIRREWWSDEGWSWKEDYDITHHAGAAAGPADAPVVHVSWFEADAFARAHDARLPTEEEWEKAATWGQIEATRQVWEWTASPFTGYAGFAAHPYREYSEVFFGDRYRVLRGGSCATHPRVATMTFRNWDLPLRRQLFSGVRLAR
ncbi:MAG TPA: SUMF1/EgtB/PvdO family nonheme iron enzyme [Candidatus Dormibacteraeota bacterium]